VGEIETPCISLLSPSLQCKHKGYAKQTVCNPSVIN